MSQLKPASPQANNRNDQQVRDYEGDVPEQSEGQGA
jgi:hypothetical protein